VKSNINKWVGEGQIASELTLRNTKNNYQVINFILRVTDSYKIKEENSRIVWQEKTTHIPVVAWEEKATSTALKYKKNDTVRIVGRLNKPTTKNLDKPNQFEIVLEDISMIGSD
tara:strand:- start:99 stop:440 length:342 start_codon:yes stop_codon:yes gene_type:complete